MFSLVTLIYNKLQKAIVCNDSNKKAWPLQRLVHIHTQVMSVKNTSVCLQYQHQRQLVKFHLSYENGNPSNFESLL